MAFQNQFSLSLDILQLVPPIVSLAESGYGYARAMTLARVLQSSGSDIVVEEDFAELFGHSRIAQNLESSFRTVVANSFPPHKLCEGFFLQRGPGPTVIRALRSQNSTYLSAVIQCSFLTCVHSNASLAAVLSQFLQKRAAEAYRKHVGGKDMENAREAPSDVLIQGFLRACQDQTAEYDWCRNLDAVRDTLALRTNPSIEAIPRVIFEGLLSMMPLVQHMPEHYIDIRTESGICSIVVWSHHVLGLSVLVKTKDKGSCQTFRFGTAPEQIVVEFAPAHSWKDNSITLLSSAGEELLFLKPEMDEEKLKSSLKRPARGYAKRMLWNEFNDEEQVERIIAEASLIICAFTICISKKLYRVQPLLTYSGTHAEVDSSSSFEATDKVQLQHAISESAVLEAARLLFDQKLNVKSIDDYVQLFNDVKPLAIPPKSFIPILRECSNENLVWNRVAYITTQLSTLIIAFSHADDLGVAADVLLSEKAPVTITEFHSSVLDWNGKDLIPIEKKDSFDLLALLMVGDTGETDFSNVCLLSDRGWSMFMTTFREGDPSYMAPGSISIQRGVPCRRSVRKHRIVDSFSLWDLDHDSFPSQIVGRANEKISLSCPERVTFTDPIIGENGDSFVVGLRLKIQHDASDSTSRFFRTNYSNLYNGLWITQNSKTICQHPVRKKELVALPPGSVALHGSPLTASNSKEASARVFVCLTDDTTAARWRALVDVLEISQSTFPQVLLRGPDCCLQCAVDEVSGRPGKWYLIT